MVKKKVPIVIYMSNIKGLGATRLASCILPAFIELYDGLRFFVPFGSSLLPIGVHTQVTYVTRYLPNSVSRFFEVFIKKKFGSAVINFTDIPLRCDDTQILFLQNPHVFKCSLNASSFKSRIFRYLMRRNLSFVDKVIVQTRHMKQRFLSTYDFDGDRVFVLAQPAPAPNLEDITTLYGLAPVVGVRCFFPSAVYPHKNHKLLSYIPESFFSAGNSITLTCLPSELRFLNPNWFEFLGRLDIDQVNYVYNRSGVLVFPSFDESLGLPLVEAMIRGIPIVVPDLPYATTLCGLSAFYFQADSPPDFLRALGEAVIFASEDSSVDYTEALSVIPKDWTTVVRELVDLVHTK